MHSDETRDARALLDSWRDNGADRVDPVRFCFIEAMARRASGYEGETRRRLEQRLAGLVADYGEGLARVAGTSLPPDTAPPRPGIAGDLAALTARLGRGMHATAAVPDAPATPHAAQTANARHTPAAASAHRARLAEPALADYFRDTWARVSVDLQLRESQAGVPENAGPLNTNQLVHRSLSLMREVSPGYLEQFLSYVDALAWLEGMHAISLVPDREAPRAPAPRKTRSKPAKPGSGTA